MLISSHLLSEIEQVCDRVAIIHKGRCVVQTSIDELRTHSFRVEIDVRGPAAQIEVLCRDAGASSSHAADHDGATTLVYRDPVDIPQLVRQLVQAGAEVLRVQTRRETLEEVFLRLTRTGDSDVRIDAF